jgi:hypothetical protein
VSLTVINYYTITTHNGMAPIKTGRDFEGSRCRRDCNATMRLSGGRVRGAKRRLSCEGRSDHPVLNQGRSQAPE